MIYVAIYLYLMGATTMWWFARSTHHPKAGKALAVVFWPVIVPAAALWA
jgi:hypothetical protein